MKNQSTVVNLDSTTFEKYSTNDTLKSYFSQRKQAYLGTHLSLTLSLIKNNPDYQEELEHLMSHGEKLLHQIITYDNEWDMERCPTPYQMNKLIDWEKTPNGDPEWMWMLNRQRYLIQLVQLYSLTKDEKYLFCFFDWLEQWISYHKKPLTHYARTSCRTIDTGIRLKNWCFCLMMIFQQDEAMDLFPSELLVKVLRSIQEQIVYLMSPKNLAVAPVSNWKILEMNGVIAALSLFPELRVPTDYLKKSIDYLNESAELQIRKDGLHWEQSFMYHHEVFLSLLEILELGHRLGFEKQLSFKKKVQQMLVVSLALTKPDGKQSPFGDSDEEKMASLLTKAALILRSSQAKFLGETRLSFETLFFYGGTAKEEYEQLPSLTPNFDKLVLPDSGLIFLRDSWTNSGIYTMFASGPQGGGHGHCNLLHLEIHAGNDYLLTDSGRFTYLEGSQTRKTFKSGIAHNVPTVDNQEFTRQEGSWTFQSVGHSLPTYVRLTDSVDYIEGSHLGYMNDSMNVFTQRKLFYIQKGIWLIIDYFHTNEPHSYQQHFHFPNTLLEQINENEFVYSGDEHQLFIQTLKTKNSCIKIEDAWYSPRYNESHQSKKMIHESSEPIMVSVLSLDQSIQLKERKLVDLYHTEIASKYACCYEITDNRDTHQIILTHLEDQTSSSRKVYQLDELKVVARAAYSKNSTNKIILKG
ncbi:hypothetical protein IGI37_002170 [Enterococcus sp. AZ194]|uniref:alginate lyase family protein n=1 Tax=Enterococcus sp. AZ194 TaxID=2774629 RepID=UPI003F270018